MRDFRVYGHYNNKGLFYVGATSKRYRHKDAYGRSDKWSKEARNGWYSVILSDGLSKEDASDVEELIVSVYRDSLTNLRDGGLFGTVWKHSQEAKDKIGKKVVDIETGMVFSSTVECAKFLNMSRSKLKHQLRGTVKNKTNIRYYQ